MASKQQLKMPQIRKKKKTNKKSPKLNFLTEFDLKKKKKRSTQVWWEKNFQGTKFKRNSQYNLYLKRNS